MDDLLLGALGAQRGRPAEALALVALALLLGAVAPLAGCGGPGEPEVAAGGLPAPGGGGSLAYALPSVPSDLDPLFASGPGAVVSRQIFEPLAGSLRPPFGGRRRAGLLAASLRPSRDRTVWSVQLRAGVRFQDGGPLNAAAVVANSRRWTSLPAGRRLLPDLFAVDAPRPNEVRFQLDRPVPDLPRLLSDPRLAIVSPRALDPAGGEGARFQPGATGAGTGPFRVESHRRSQVELERNPAWWGSALGLGPALETVEFVGERRAPVRVRMLLDGDVQVAGPFPGGALARLGARPLLSAHRATAGGVASEASVRGLGVGPAPALSGTWLTTLAG